MKPLVDIIIIGSKPIKGMKSKGCLSNVKINKYQSILYNQIKNIKKKNNVNKILYVGGHLIEELKKGYDGDSAVDFIENTSYNLYNNAYSLKLGIEKVQTDRVFVVFNKILFSHKIFNFFNFNESQIFILDKTTYKIGSIIENNEIRNLFYNLNNNGCGIYYLTNNELNIVKSILCDTSTNPNMFIFEIINRALELGANFKANFVKDKKHIFEIQDSYTLKKLKTHYAKNFDA